MSVQEPLFRLFSFRSLTSTMDEARTIARSGFEGPAIVRADTQTSGRGRIVGRRWVDSPGMSLLMTILLPAGFDEAKALPLRAGLGVVRALEDAARAELWLKWPNDVLAQKSSVAALSGDDLCGTLEYGKLCGILCESTADRILIGIGINLRRAAYSGTTAWPQSDISPVSLEEIMGFLPEPFTELDHAARVVARHITDALSDPQWRPQYEHRLWGLGSTVQFLAGHPQNPEPVRGTCVGVDEEGRLILDIEGEQKSFASGEIASLRVV